MCIDYRALNAMTDKNGYSLPRIQEYLDWLSTSVYLIKIDFKSRYWQVWVTKKHIPKTAFNTWYGKFKFMAISFGLTNAWTMFQSIMINIFQLYLDKFAIVYFDDIVIYSKTKEENLEHVEKILKALSNHQIYAKPSNCIIGVKSWEFYKHVIGNGTGKSVIFKVKIINKWLIPKTVYEVQQFLGLVFYYRRLVKEFARMAGSLFDLLKEDNTEIQKKKHWLIR